MNILIQFSVTGSHYSQPKMSTYWHAAALWIALLAGLFGSIGADEIEVSMEKDLRSFVAKTEFVIVLYCT